jgi:hypothetical protein
MAVLIPVHRVTETAEPQHPFDQCWGSSFEIQAHAGPSVANAVAPAGIGARRAPSGRGFNNPAQKTTRSFSARMTILLIRLRP